LEGTEAGYPVLDVPSIDEERHPAMA